MGVGLATPTVPVLTAVLHPIALQVYVYVCAYVSVVGGGGFCATGLGSFFR